MGTKCHEFRPPRPKVTTFLSFSINLANQDVRGTNRLEHKVRLEEYSVLLLRNRPAKSTYQFHHFLEVIPEVVPLIPVHLIWALWTYTRVHVLQTFLPNKHPPMVDPRCPSQPQPTAVAKPAVALTGAALGRLGPAADAPPAPARDKWVQDDESEEGE